MEKGLEELKQHLMATNEEFSRLATEHLEQKRKLEHLSGRSHLTENERLEEINLKKRKLFLKDQMEKILQKCKRDSCLAL